VTDIFEEVSADLRRDRMQTAWDKYGRYIIGLAIAIIVLTAGNIGLSSYWRAQDEAASARYDALQATLGDADGAARLAALSDFAAVEDNGYGVLARFSIAYIHTESKDNAAALAAFDALADDGSVPGALRDYAALQGAIVALNDGAPLDAIEARLADLLSDDNGLAAVARETMALAYIRDDRPLEARDLLLAQLTSADASSLSRERANIMLQKISSSLVSAPIAEAAQQGDTE
jgi:hypothetical protein